MKIRKRLLLLLTALLMAAGVEKGTIKAYAEEPVIQDVNIQSVGGQIRTTEPMGLRMLSCVKESYLEELEKTGTVEYGTVVLPSKYLGGQELKADKTYYSDGKVYKPKVVRADKVWARKDGLIYFNAVLTNLAPERYKEDYASRPYVKVTTDTDGKKKTTYYYSEEEMERQVYQVAEDAIAGNIEDDATKEWLKENVIQKSDPYEPSEEDKTLKFQMDKPKMVTLYTKQGESVEEVSHFKLSEFKGNYQDYLVKVELDGQPDTFAEITEVVEDGAKVGFKLNLENYVTVSGTQTKEGAYIDFGRKAADGDTVETSYITMQALVDKINADPSGTYELDHDMDASLLGSGKAAVTQPFTGTLNGNGYKITGLSSALFANIQGGTVQNLIIENANVTWNNNMEVGILAARTQSGAYIENVHVNGNVTGDKGRVGGLIGLMNDTTIQSCTANVSVTGKTGSVGGLAGVAELGTKVYDSYAIGKVTGDSNGRAWGGLVGWVGGNVVGSSASEILIDRCYANVKLNSNEGNGGGLIGHIGSGTPNGVTIQNSVSYSSGKGTKFYGNTQDSNSIYTAALNNNYVLSESSLTSDAEREWASIMQEGKVMVRTLEELSQKELYTSMGWDETVWNLSILEDQKAPKLNNSDQNMNMMLEVIEISSAEDLQAISKKPDSNYVLVTDIDVSEITSGDTIVTGTFSGTLKGNRHHIVGQKLPLFNTLQGATVENFFLEDGEIKGAQRIAPLAKAATSRTEIRHVFVEDATVSATDRDATGFVATMNNSTIQESSSEAEVTAAKGWCAGFVALMENKSLIENSYTKGKVETSDSAAQGGFVSEIQSNSTVRNCYTESKVIKNGTATDAGGFVGRTTNPASVANNISFATGKNGFRFAGMNTAQGDFANYRNNYEYEGSDLKPSSDKNLTLDGKIATVSDTDVENGEFYKNTLQFDETIWNLEEIDSTKRPRLIAQGEEYDYESNITVQDFSGQADPEEAVTEEEETANLEESISNINAQNVEESTLAVEEWKSLPEYREEKQTAYENMKKFMPFLENSRVIQEANQLPDGYVLATKRILAVYPLNEKGERVVAMDSEQAQNITKIRVQFEDETAVIYNVTYVNTRNEIASYVIPQFGIHYNFNKYIINTESDSFRTLEDTIEGYTFDQDIKGRVSQADSDTVIHSYKKNFDTTVKQERESVLVSMLANYQKYPVNLDNAIAKQIVTDQLITNEYLKDFLYAYNYLDRWYDFLIGGVNLRDVVAFDNSILKNDKNPQNMLAEICAVSSSGGRQGNNTQSLYTNRVAPYTGISDVATFVEYFMRVYAGYADVNDWIVENFTGGIAVEARANNPKITDQTRMWPMIKKNTVHRDGQMILPTLSYKTTKNLYLASFPTSIVYGNLQIYSGPLESNRTKIQSQLNQFKNIYDNFADVAANGANSINNSKFLIVDTSYNKDRTQDVYQEYYRPLQTLWASKNGAVAVLFGTPERDYIYYNSASFIGDQATLAHEMGHVTDMWIWMENKGKRPGRNGEDYANGFTNQAVLDYNMNFMEKYGLDSDKMTNLTPERIKSQENFKSFYKQVFEAIYTLDYLQGKAYLELTPEQQAAVTLQHRYGTIGNYQTANSANSTWRRISASELTNMKLQTLDDLWDNQLTIRPGMRYDLSSQGNVGINNLGAYNLDKVSYASWYVPYVNGGTPNAQTFRRNGYELGGMFGYSDGLVEYMSNQTKTGDLAYFQKKLGGNFTFESYRKNKNVEIEQKIAAQKEQGNAYFDEELLIEYFKQAMLNPGVSIDSGASSTNTLGNIKNARENVYRYLQRITNDFRTPIYSEDASGRNAVSITSAKELVDAVNSNPNGFYILENDIDMSEVSVSNGVYINKTLIGKLDGNGHTIKNASAKILNRVSNSYVSNLTIQTPEGKTDNGLLANSVGWTVSVTGKKEEKEISTLEELKTIGNGEYKKYRLTADIDASGFTGNALITKSFSAELDGDGHAITGLKAPLFAEVSSGTVKNLNLKDVNVTKSGEYANALTQKSNKAVFENISLENITLKGTGYVAPISGYDNIASSFSRIQVKNADVTSSTNYSSAFVGRAAASVITDVSVIDSRVEVEKTDNGGFIGMADSVTVSNVYNGADLVIEDYTGNNYASAGFIGNIAGTSSIQNVIQAGNVDNQDAEAAIYKFTASTDVIPSAVQNAYELAGTTGVSNVTEGTEGHLAEAAMEQKKQKEFYRDTLGFSEDNWYLDLVALREYPEIRGFEVVETFSISKAEDFAMMAAYPQLAYQLEADIDFSGTEQQDCIVSEFSGTLHGNGHKITGLRVPLFGNLGGTVEKLLISQSRLESAGDGQTGVLASVMNQANVSEIAFQDNQIVQTNGRAALLAAEAHDSVVQNVLALENRIEAVSGGGLIGTAQNMTVSDVYLSTNLVVQDAAGSGGLAGSTEGTSSYRNIVTTGDVGEGVPKVMHDVSAVENGFEFKLSSGTSSAAEGHVAEAGDEIWRKDFYQEQLGLNTDVWSLEHVSENGYPELKNVSVTAAPFELVLSAPEDIQKLNQMPTGSFSLKNDIDFTGYEGEMVTEEFTGEVNGNGYTITGLKTPMFAMLKGSVENVVFQNILIQSEGEGTNVLAKEAEGAKVSQVFFNGITLSGGKYTGIVGRDRGSKYSSVGIENTDVTAGGSYSGTMIGDADGTTVQNVAVAAAELTNTDHTYVGGMIGKLKDTTIESAVSDVNLNAPAGDAAEYTSAFLGGLEGDGNSIKNAVSAGGVHPEDKDKKRFKTVYVKGNETAYFENTFENSNEAGMATSGINQATLANLKNETFYRNSLKLSADIWDFSGVAKRGWARLKGMPERVKAPKTTTETDAPLIENDVPDGYTAVRTTDELLAIRNNPNGKYILMNSISLFDRWADGDSFLGDFGGELHGNGQTIRDIEGKPLFNNVTGQIHDLAVKDVRVEVLDKNLAANYLMANAVAKALNGATIRNLSLKHVVLVGGYKTATLAGSATNADISGIWAEGISVNPYGPVHYKSDPNLIKQNAGLIGTLSDSRLADSYIGGEITVNGSYQGGVIGQIIYAFTKPTERVVSNMRIKGLSEVSSNNRGGFVGEFPTSASSRQNMKNLIALGDAGVNKAEGSYYESYRFGAGDSSWATNVFETATGGIQSVSVTDRQYEQAFYEGTLGFSADTWDFSTVAEKGYPTLKWAMDTEEPDKPVDPEPPVDPEEPDVPGGPEVEDYPLLEETVPEGFTAIRTAKDLLAIHENPSGNYILMKNISLYGKEDETGAFIGEFSGELRGNNQVIYGLNGASLFATVSGTVKDLRLQHVENKKDTETGANAFAYKLDGANIQNIYMDHITLNGADLTGALAGEANNSTINGIWAENLSVNLDYELAIGYFNRVGGIVGHMKEGSKLENVYVSGIAKFDGYRQGGIVGEMGTTDEINNTEAPVEASTMNHAVGNMKIISTVFPGPSQYGRYVTKAGILGLPNTKGDSGTGLPEVNIKISNSISIADTSADESVGGTEASFKFLPYVGKDPGGYGDLGEPVINAVLQNCYELNDGKGLASASDNTSAAGSLYSISTSRDVELYQTALGFDSAVWDFSTIAEKGYPTLR